LLVPSLLSIHPTLALITVSRCLVKVVLMFTELFVFLWSSGWNSSAIG
jgi:hypothetical protein